MAKKGYFTERLIAQLAHDGEVAIQDAYSRKTYENRMYNLRDSYGSAVYVNGVLRKDTIRYLGPEQSKGGLSMGWTWTKGRTMPDYKGNRRLTGDEVLMNGREEVMDFFAHYKPEGKGIQLVVVAAMWYASVLEKGGGNLRRKYRVISGARTQMDSLAAKYGGASVKRISTWRDLSQMTTPKNKSWK